MMASPNTGTSCYTFREHAFSLLTRLGRGRLMASWNVGKIRNYNTSQNTKTKVPITQLSLFFFFPFNPQFTPGDALCWIFWGFCTINEVAAAAAAAATSLQSCPTLCDPTDGSPWGSPVPGILQARTLEWVAISFSNAWKWSCSVMSDS